jgi:molybdate transport system substrate-binding protein
MLKQRRRLVQAALLALWVCGGTRLSAQDITVAAASDLQSVFPVLAAQFQEETGRRVGITFGSSGNFFVQLTNGAPFDLFFSADIDYPRQLDAAGLTEPGTLYEYATGHIVMWTRNGSGIDVQAGLQALLDPAVKRIAIANPEHAPYGRAAVAALQHESLYDKVRGKLVLGENISQAAQYVESGNAETGILALSLALAPALKDSGTYYEIPPSFYPPIEQGAVLLKSSRHKDVAKQFLAFLKTPAVARQLQAFGFAVPGAALAR